MKNYVINKYCFFLVFLSILNACGFIGGDEKVSPNEAAVLSGPPLAIPPDFDDQGQPVNALAVPSPVDVVDQRGDEGYANIPTLEEEAQYYDQQQSFENSQETIQTFDSNNVQSFETYEPNQIQAFVPQQMQNKKAKMSKQPKRASVPSDVYDVDVNRLNSMNQKTRVSKNYFDNNSIKNRVQIQNNQNLSKEEESLLEEIIINDFESSGDSD